MSCLRICPANTRHDESVANFTAHHIHLFYDRRQLHKTGIFSVHINNRRMEVVAATATSTLAAMNYAYCFCVLVRNTFVVSPILAHTKQHTHTNTLQLYHFTISCALSCFLTRACACEQAVPIARHKVDARRACACAIAPRRSHGAGND